MSNHRKNKGYALFILLLVTLLLPALAAAQSAEEIVRRAEQVRGYDSAYIEARMVNNDRFGSKSISYRAWARGDNFLMEMTSDAEYGQKILRTEDRVYHFFPDSEAIFTKSKGDSIVGLISYEDVTDESRILDNYTVRLDGEESLNGIPCYRVDMEVKRGRRVAYPRQTVWIERENYIIRKVRMFTRTGTPLKTMEVRRVEEIDGQRIATDILITDNVRTDVTSEIFIDQAELNLPIDDRRFTRRELSR
ncbi:MAG TPA: outer membrane lipoprotein-sorting protein [Sediminispirochaeta sp.]|nr:outer membrane lipoprotein-sorting protein [Sediminispirochaeta sp.]